MISQTPRASFDNNNGHDEDGLVRRKPHFFERIASQAAAATTVASREHVCTPVGTMDSQTRIGYSGQPVSRSVDLSPHILSLTGIAISNRLHCKPM